MPHETAGRCVKNIHTQPHATCQHCMPTHTSTVASGLLRAHARTDTNTYAHVTCAPVCYAAALIQPACMCCLFVSRSRLSVPCMHFGTTDQTANTHCTLAARPQRQHRPRAGASVLRSPMVSDVATEQPAITCIRHTNKRQHTHYALACTAVTCNCVSH
jgi:hypothetical protein